MVCVWIFFPFRLWPDFWLNVTSSIAKWKAFKTCSIVCALTSAVPSSKNININWINVEIIAHRNECIYRIESDGSCNANKVCEEKETRNKCEIFTRFLSSWWLIRMAVDAICPVQNILKITLNWIKTTGQKCVRCVKEKTTRSTNGLGIFTLPNKVIIHASHRKNRERSKTKNKKQMKTKSGIGWIERSTVCLVSSQHESANCTSISIKHRNK